MSSMLEWALYYAKRGMAVIPIPPGKKGSVMTDWADKATTDPEQIKEWWTKWPNDNVGFVTGQKSNGIWAIDLDVDEDKGEDGRETLRRWEMDNGIKLPDTWQDISGRGGNHLYFHSDTTIPNDLRDTYPDIEIRGEGLLVVLPPSLHKTGSHYQWEVGYAPWEIKIAETDDAVKKFIGYGTKKRESFHTPEVIPEGTRNETLFKLACSMRARGDPEAAIRAAVSATNESNCKPPLSDKDIDTLIDSALKYESGTAKVTATVKNGAIVPLHKARPPEIVTADSTAEREAEWLIPEYIPKNQITVLAGSGGTGKTTIWCALAAAISAGTPSFLERDIPKEWIDRKPAKVLYLSSEDSTEYVLRRRLRLNGANLENIGYVDIKDEAFTDILFDSETLEKLIDDFRPELLIFDPVQSFVPANIHMGDRNAMRQCLSPLIGYGERYNVTSLIVVHANKQANVWGKKRIADSADIWDISRSVLMTGETNERGIFYLTHEKSNYGATGQTLLYSLDGEKINFKGFTDRKDKDFVCEIDYSARPSPAKNEAQDFILSYLSDGEKTVGDLDEAAKAYGIKDKTLRTAKAALKKSEEIKMRHVAPGQGKGVQWYVSLTK